MSGRRGWEKERWKFLSVIDVAPDVCQRELLGVLRARKPGPEDCEHLRKSSMANTVDICLGGRGGGGERREVELMEKGRW